MTSNILRAISNIVDFGSNNLKSYASNYLIRINAIGEQLEYYTQDAIADSFRFSQEKKEEAYSKVFSWLGNQNHPPDMIIKGSDAFEIKKIENQKSALALNSSPPKDKLLASDIRITKDCKNCETEEWKEKDIFYVIGHATKGEIKYLFFVQGTCYAAKHEVYDRIHTPIKEEVDSVLDSLHLEKGKTVELGKVKRVDPLGITELRIRGMWQIQNPLRVYENFCKIEDKEKFHLFALMRKDKYDSFPQEDRDELEKNKEVFVQDLKIKDPNNPANLVEAKLISYKEK
ncbi:MAG: NgoPII family restriction endonuclease [Candidatus Margulisbacteria bacterium]|nr:NgoPII family restriction endonuclease [Candidatus Margulisiibacteriota bacterium]